MLLVLQLLQLTPLGTLRSPYTFENLLDLYTLHGPCAPIGPIPPLTTCWTVAPLDLFWNPPWWTGVGPAGPVTPTRRPIGPALRRTRPVVLLSPWVPILPVVLLILLFLYPLKMLLHVLPVIPCTTLGPCKLSYTCYPLLFALYLGHLDSSKPVGHLHLFSWLLVGFFFQFLVTLEPFFPL